MGYPVRRAVFVIADPESSSLSVLKDTSESRRWSFAHRPHRELYKSTIYVHRHSSSFNFSSFRSHPPSTFDSEWLARDAGCTGTVNTPATHTYSTCCAKYVLRSPALPTLPPPCAGDRFGGGGTQESRRPIDSQDSAGRGQSPSARIERVTLEHPRDPSQPSRIDFNPRCARA